MTAATLFARTLIVGADSADEPPHAVEKSKTSYLHTEKLASFPGLPHLRVRLRGVMVAHADS